MNKATKSKKALTTVNARSLTTRMVVLASVWAFVIQLLLEMRDDYTIPSWVVLASAIGACFTFAVVVNFTITHTRPNAA